MPEQFTVSFVSVGHTVEHLEADDPAFLARAQGRDYGAVTLLLRDGGWQRESESWDAATNRRHERWSRSTARDVLKLEFSTEDFRCDAVSLNGRAQADSPLLGRSAAAVQRELLADGWQLSHVWGGSDGQQHTYFRPS
jgi:hypothetical protein